MLLLLEQLRGSLQPFMPALGLHWKIDPLVHACCRYDPMAIKAGNPGYGAGSGAPNVMLAFLKHTWITG